MSEIQKTYEQLKSLRSEIVETEQLLDQVRQGLDAARLEENRLSRKLEILVIEKSFKVSKNGIADYNCVN